MSNVQARGGVTRHANSRGQVELARHVGSALAHVHRDELEPDGAVRLDGLGKVLVLGVAGPRPEDEAELLHVVGRRRRAVEHVRPGGDGLQAVAGAEGGCAAVAGVVRLVEDDDCATRGGEPRADRLDGEERHPLPSV